MMRVTVLCLEGPLYEELRVPHAVIMSSRNIQYISVKLRRLSYWLRIHKLRPIFSGTGPATGDLRFADKRDKGLMTRTTRPSCR